MSWTGLEGEAHVLLHQVAERLAEHQRA